MRVDDSWRPDAGHVAQIKIYLLRCCRALALGFAIVVGAFSALMLASGCTHPATVSGMAVSFDGSTADVSIPVVTTSTENVTLESWVKLPDGAKGCFVKVGDANTGYGIGVGSARTNFDAGSGGNALMGLYENSAWLYPADDPTLSTGVWHHIAFVIGAAGSAPTFYIDGTPHAATTPGTPHAPIDGAVIGKDLGGDRSTNAMLAKVAVYNTALSPTRITAHATATSEANYDAAVLADSPVAFYQLNEQNGPSASDSSGNSNTGTYSGAVAFLQPGPFASTQQPKEQPTQQ
jgi:hypothetical protein